MAITMFWQTKITPSTADPAQRASDAHAADVHRVFSVAPAAGIYWFVSNLWRSASNTSRLDDRTAHGRSGSSPASAGQEVGAGPHH